jgi:hypothetical protein
MTKILISSDNPKGIKLEILLDHVRGDLMQRCAHIVDDPRPDSVIVLRNNIEIMGLLGQCLERAHESAKALKRLG